MGFGSCGLVAWLLYKDKIGMISELKKRMDAWFGDNADDEQEEQFIAGWIGCSCDHISKKVTGNWDQGHHVREIYDKE